MNDPALRVGEVAKRTGLTVRTLHHYHELGLVVPTHHSPAGHRLYRAADLVRLHRICLLRELGFSLADIGRMLDDPAVDLVSIVERYQRDVATQIEESERLHQKLIQAAAWLRSTDTPSIDAWVQRIAETDMHDLFAKYYTPEQLSYLQERAAIVGEQRIREVEAEWPRLIAAVRAEMAAGTPPEDPRVQELARQWRGLIEEFSGGDAGIEASLANLYRDQPTVANQPTGVELDGSVFAYVAKAHAEPPRNA